MKFCIYDIQKKKEISYRLKLYKKHNNLYIIDVWSIYVQPCMVNHRCEKRSSWAQLDDHRIPSHLRLLSTDPFVLASSAFSLFFGGSPSHI